MQKKVDWEKELDKALERSKSEGKPIFLDFFNPQ